MRSRMNPTEPFLCHDNDMSEHLWSGTTTSGATLKKIEFVFLFAQVSRMNPNVAEVGRAKRTHRIPKGGGTVWEEPYACRRALRLSTACCSLSKCRWRCPVPPAGARWSTGTWPLSPRLCRCHEGPGASRAGAGGGGCTALQSKHTATQCSATARSDGPLRFYWHQTVNQFQLMVKTNTRSRGGRCRLLCQAAAHGQPPSISAGLLQHKATHVVTLSAQTGACWTLKHYKHCHFWVAWSPTDPCLVGFCLI